MESMNFLTNSPGCLAGHASLPMESPEMSNCPASQSQETVEAKREPTTPSPNFPPTLQCESAGQSGVVNNREGSLNEDMSTEGCL